MWADLTADPFGVVVQTRDRGFSLVIFLIIPLKKSDGSRGCIAANAPILFPCKNSLGEAMAKRGRGRPKLAKDVESVTLTLPKAMVRRIDRLAAEAFDTRSAVMRALLEAGLKRAGK